jgi:hypothetical protein
VGTTLETMQDESGLAYQLVIAIEGLPYLITNGETAAVVTAWSGTDWSTAIGGLFVEADFEQQIDPWEPIVPGPDLTFFVRDVTGNDIFGSEVFCGGVDGVGSETTLKTSIDSDATTIPATSVDEFLSEGEFFIGVESIGYGGRDTSADTFTSCVRGKYSPFKADTESGTRFGRPHRAGSPTDFSPVANPWITLRCRTWQGKHVGLWLHRRRGTVLDTRAEAQLLWAGKIVEIRDTSNGDTRVTCEHVLSTVANAVVLREPWQAEVQQGVYLAPSTAGPEFNFRTIVVGEVGGVFQVTRDDADPLVVTNGASGAYQIEDGYHDLDSIISALNRWLAQALEDGDINMSMAFEVQGSDVGSRRVAIKWDLQGTGSDAGWVLTAPAQVWRFLGFEVGNVGYGGTFEVGDGSNSLKDTKIAENPPMISAPWTRAQATGNTVDLVNTSGVFIDQSDTLPALARAHVDSSNPWGLVVIEGAVFLVEMITATTLGKVVYIAALQGFVNGSVTLEQVDQIGRVSDSTGAPLVVRQVVILEGSFSELVPQLFASTGTNGYNHATYDALGPGLGLGVPWQLLGQTFVDSCALLDEANSAAALVMVIEKPTKLIELLGSDLILRRCHLIWKNQGLRFTSWSTPSTARAIHTLTEANKASPSDQRDANRSPMDFTNEWMRNVLELHYNRKLGDTDSYDPPLIFEDRASIDDTGEARKQVIKARNSYGSYASTGEAVEALAPALLAWMPYFSRPVKIIARTIDLSLFENVAPGDVVILSDSFARDPRTGRRGIVDKAGIIVWHRWSLGGRDPGDPKSALPMEGEVRVAVFDLDRNFTWSPAAMLDPDADSDGFSSGYNSSTTTVRCIANEYSDPGDGVSDTSFFAIGDEVIVTEIDPDDPDSPLTWDRSITGKSGNDLTINSALSSPSYDAAKKYRVIPQLYADVESTQQAKAFQAGTNQIIQGEAPAHQWGADLGPETFPAVGFDALPERYSSQSYGDGAPLDVGFETGLLRMVQNLVSYKTAPQSPAQTYAVSGHSSVTGGAWKLFAVMPIYLGPPVTAGNRARFLYVAPFFRSTDGTSVSMQIWLSRQPPTGTSLEAFSVQGPRRLATFTTTSTGYTIPTVQALDCHVADAEGEAYLILAVNHTKLQTAGLGACYVGPLETA